MSVSLISLEDPVGQAVPLAPWMSPRSMGLVYGGCEILTACEGDEQDFSCLAGRSVRGR